jgi:transcriptional regulator of acetoin/glycerol metabolism
MSTAYGPNHHAEIITQSKTMLAIFRYVDTIAPSPQPVLITGETGTGKELTARALHRLAPGHGEFVAVNVPGLDDTMFSDTLFGHTKGAFTRADRLPTRCRRIRRAAVMHIHSASTWRGALWTCTRSVRRSVKLDKGNHQLLHRTVDTGCC